MFYIVGLGNPGEKYASQRHNAGAQALQYCSAHHHFPKAFLNHTANAYIREASVKDISVTAIFPQTFMNASGSAVAKLVGKNDVYPNLVVLYDDIDLPMGSIRISYGRGAGGHNGVASVINSLGTKDFVRIRIGIAPVSIFGTIKKPSGKVLRDFVLKPFTRREQRLLTAHVFPDVCKAMERILEDGYQKAMNQHTGDTYK